VVFFASIVVLFAKKKKICEYSGVTIIFCEYSGVIYTDFRVFFFVLSLC